MGLRLFNRLRVLPDTLLDHLQQTGGDGSGVEAGEERKRVRSWGWQLAQGEAVIKC